MTSSRIRSMFKKDKENAHTEHRTDLVDEGDRERERKKKRRSFTSKPAKVITHDNDNAYDSVEDDVARDAGSAFHPLSPTGDSATNLSVPLAVLMKNTATAGSSVIDKQQLSTTPPNSTTQTQTASPNQPEILHKTPSDKEMLKTLMSDKVPRTAVGKLRMKDKSRTGK